MKPKIVTKPEKLPDATISHPQYHPYAAHEEKVFMEATKFVVFERVKGIRRRLEFDDFAEALLQAYGNPRALVYAIDKSGMSVCIARNDWTKYLEIWKREVVGT